MLDGGWMIEEACPGRRRAGHRSHAASSSAATVAPDWERRAARFRPAVRVLAAVYPSYLDAAIKRGLRTGDEIGSLVGVGPLKLFTDGSLNTRTAPVRADPYPGLEGTDGARGIEETAPDELVRLMRRAAAHGIEPAVHAIGDARQHRCPGRLRGGALPRPHRARTAAEPRRPPRFAELGVIAGVQPRHATDDRDVADRHWAGRTERAFAYGDLLAAGARLEFGSDAPVSPLDPGSPSPRPSAAPTTNAPPGIRSNACPSRTRWSPRRVAAGSSGSGTRQTWSSWTWTRWTPIRTPCARCRCMPP
ncbi:amidohydrolase family protein [Streptomyces sp. L7]